MHSAGYEPRLVSHRTLRPLFGGMGHVDFTVMVSDVVVTTGTLGQVDEMVCPSRRRCMCGFVIPDNPIITHGVIQLPFRAHEE